MRIAVLLFLLVFSSCSGGAQTKASFVHPSFTFDKKIERETAVTVCFSFMKPLTKILAYYDELFPEDGWTLTRREVLPEEVTKCGDTFVRVYNRQEQTVKMTLCGTESSKTLNDIYFNLEDITPEELFGEEILSKE